MIRIIAKSKVGAARKSKEPYQKQAVLLGNTIFGSAEEGDKIVVLVNSANIFVGLYLRVESREGPKQPAKKQPDAF